MNANLTNLPRYWSPPLRPNPELAFSIECLLGVVWRRVATKAGSLDDAIDHCFNSYSAAVRIVDMGRVVFERAVDDRANYELLADCEIWRTDVT